VKKVRHISDDLKRKIKMVLRYDPDTGVLTKIGHIPRTDGKKPKHITCINGSATPKGYITMSIDGSSYLAHRLAFVLMDYEVPDCVDHINGNKSDNRWCNLRPASNTLNYLNRHKKTGRCKDLPVGVTMFWRKDKAGYWYRVKIQSNGKTKETNTRYRDKAIRLISEWRGGLIREEEAKMRGALDAGKV